MYSFNDLEFTSEGFWYPVSRAKIFFPNWYGASVVRGYWTYWVEQWLYELAVLSWKDEGNWDICYDTDITGDVLGYLSEQDVTDLLNRIANL